MEKWGGLGRIGPDRTYGTNRSYDEGTRAHAKGAGNAEKKDREKLLSKRGHGGETQ